MRILIYLFSFALSLFASWFFAWQGSFLETGDGFLVWYVMSSTGAFIIAVLSLFQVFKDDL